VSLIGAVWFPLPEKPSGKVDRTVSFGHSVDETLHAELVAGLS
jgi:hypothetical protein